MRILKSGDPCPFCGQPLRQTDPDALRRLSRTLLGSRTRKRRV